MTARDTLRPITEVIRYVGSDRVIALRLTVYVPDG